MSRWEPVIGLEVHVQLKTATKIFCRCPTDFGAAPNEHTCPVCLGLPGVLPVINEHAVTLAARGALALGMTVHLQSQFARKNYFYPDLPKGYQISQFDRPIGTDGSLTIWVDGEEKTIGIERLHMEEDAGKNVHLSTGGISLVDLNRAGVPLGEIVSHPDLRSVEEVTAYLKELRSVMRYAGVTDGNMEEGSFRCDANVSVRPGPDAPFGTRTEIKNMNSFRHIRQAVTWEIERQVEVIEGGGTVQQETRLWDPEKGITQTMRSKADAHDYRYFPDPDLPPLEVSAARRAAIAAALPELPRSRRLRYQKDWGLPAYDAAVLTTERDVADFFEATVAAGAAAKAASNWVMGSLLAQLAKGDRSLEDLPITPSALAKLIELVDAGTLGRAGAKEVFEVLCEREEDPAAVMERLGLEQVSDRGAIASEVQAIVEAHADELTRYRAGERKLFGFFMGQVMRAMAGKGDPAEVRKALQDALES